MKSRWEFRAEDGEVRAIRFDGVPVVDRIYAAIRDENWATLTPTHQATVGTETRFRLDDRYEWSVGVESDADSLTVTFAGRARGEFRRNRIGLCALLPASLAGTPAGHSPQEGAAVERVTFPDRFTAEQPVPGFEGLRDLLLPSAGVQIEFRGDWFEMEDQRNWTDASFKIYSTSLRDPFPVTVHSGEEIRQSITIRPAALRMPTTKRGHVWSAETPLTGETAELVASLQPDFLLVDPVDAPFMRGILALLPDPAPELLVVGDPVPETVQDLLNGAGLRWRSVRTPVDHVRRSAAEIAPYREAITPDEIIGTLSDYFFLRQHPVRTPRAAVVFQANPQVHAFDSESILSAAPMVGACVRDAYASGARQVWVAPLLFQPRVNPYATGAWQRPTPDTRVTQALGLDYVRGAWQSALDAGATGVAILELGLPGLQAGDPVTEWLVGLPQR